MMNEIDSGKILKSVDHILAYNIERNVVLVKICELLKQEIFHYDWVGFYILNKGNNQLILDQYIGKHTDHIIIPVGKGVCGQVAENKATMIVQDVTQMENYIACSIDVQSEIVVPILKNNIFVAEIDIDSHSPAPFSESDKKLLESISNKLAQLF